MLHILYIIAIAAEAITAAFSAGRRNMDWVGVLIVAWVTALGGGTLRNILLGHYPMSWVAHPEYLLITAAAVLVAAVLSRFLVKLKTLFLFLDAVGLVVFTIIGCRLAQEMDLPLLIILLSGVLTGCAGGVMRDVLCNDIPLLFRKEVYASASLFTGGLYLGLEHVGLPNYWATLLAGCCGLLLRLLAIRYRWQMPRFTVQEELHN